MNRSVLKWCGNKSKVMPQITPHFDWTGIKRYVEPFSGALGSALNAGIPEEVSVLLNDANWELLNLWQEIIKDAQAIEDMANSFGISEEDYYSIRAWDKIEGWREERITLEIAARTVYLNKTCFNGNFRINRKGEYNNAWNGRKNPIRFPPLQPMLNIIRRSEMRCTDWRVVLRDCGEGDIVYCDPPYVDTKDPKKQFGGYIGAFGWQEQLHLRDELVEANRRGAQVIISNSLSEHTRELYAGWEQHVITASRSVSCKGNARKPVEELLAVLKAPAI
jgi:DNA adenine methylase